MPWITTIVVAVAKNALQMATQQKPNAATEVVKIFRPMFHIVARVPIGILAALLSLSTAIHAQVAESVREANAFAMITTHAPWTLIILKQITVSIRIVRLKVPHVMVLWDV